MNTKQRNFLIGAIVAIFLFAGSALTIFINLDNQQQESTKAAAINNKTVESQIIIAGAVKDLDERLLELETKQQALDEIDQTLNIVNQEIEEFESIDSINGDEDFKSSASELFDYYRDILKNEYSTVIVGLIFEDVNKLTSDQFSLRYNEIFDEINRDINVLTSNFLQAQKEFAAKYNLEIQ